eukprot:360784-Chlamydomonas_euryale.AAC.3
MSRPTYMPISCSPRSLIDSSSSPRSGKDVSTTMRLQRCTCAQSVSRRARAGRAGPNVQSVGGRAQMPKGCEQTCKPLLKEGGGHARRCWRGGEDMHAAVGEGGDMHAAVGGGRHPDR